MLTLIVALARNSAIGKDNGIPWHSPEDLRLFQRETTGGAVIMGRRTWESLPVKPLKNRLNIVVSRNAGLSEHVAGTVSQALTMAADAGYSRLYGIGGESIYREMLPLADRLMLTEVGLDVPDADAFFPPIREADWLELARRPLSGDGPACTLRELLRRR